MWWTRKCAYLTHLEHHFRCKITLKIRHVIDKLLRERRKNVRIGWRIQNSAQTTTVTYDFFVAFWFRIPISHLVLVFGFPMCIIVGFRAQKPNKNGQKLTTLVSQRRILTNLVSSVTQKRGRWPMFFFSESGPARRVLAVCIDNMPKVFVDICAKSL